MDERSVHQIASNRLLETGTYNKLNFSDKEEAEGIREIPVTDANRSPQRTELGNEFAKNLSNISIHFNVDDETNHLVVVVTERKSGRVIRTVPASELEKIQAGELLKLAV
jgi:uncharacterized FlaG/YvyC family protein